MKKIVILLLAVLLMAPLDMVAKKHICRKVSPASFVPRTPIHLFISVNLEQYTGNLTITPNYDIMDLDIMITGSGYTYLNTTVSLYAGWSYFNCLDFLPVGTYMMTLSTVGDVIDQYEITVEND